MLQWTCFSFWGLASGPECLVGLASFLGLESGPVSLIFRTLSITIVSRVVTSLLIQTCFNCNISYMFYKT